MNPIHTRSQAEPIPTEWSRRRLLKTLFCSSAALAMNLDVRALRADELAAGDLHILAIGDCGSQNEDQALVARAMIRYVERLQRKPDGLLLLGDNFYGRLDGGIHSERWQSGFEEMYPADVFPKPCPVVLGNHDYRDTPGGDQIQLKYAKTAGTRWTLPSRWHRINYPRLGNRPLVTLLCIDTNLPDVENTLGADQSVWPTLTSKQEAEQWAWLKKSLVGDRAPWTIVIGHHPVYSNGAHGDTPGLVKKLAPLLQAHSVGLYLCGHDHDMQHLEIERLRTSFVISGGGGGRLRQVENHERGPFSESTHGFTHLAVTGRSMVIRHINTDGKQIHAFTKYPDGRFNIE